MPIKYFVTLLPIYTSLRKVFLPVLHSADKSTDWFDFVDMFLGLNTNTMPPYCSYSKEINNNYSGQRPLYTTPKLQASKSELPDYYSKSNQ